MTTYFILVDYFRRKTNLFQYKLGQFFVSGFCASVGFWLMWPFDILKSMVQAGTKEAGNTHKERLRYMINHHGYAGLFRGLIPGTLSIFMRNGAAMVAMQYV